eukprot:365507-Chlamydomonas_euryale.AAC.1
MCAWFGLRNMLQAAAQHVSNVDQTSKQEEASSLQDGVHSALQSLQYSEGPFPSSPALGLQCGIKQSYKQHKIWHGAQCVSTL